MSRRFSLSIVFIASWSALGPAGPMVSAQVPDAARADSTLPQLLQPVGLVQRTSRVIGPEVMRRLAVGVDAELLKKLDLRGDNQLVFNLFPDTTFTGRVEGKTFPGARIGFLDSFSLRGSIQGISGSSFQLVYHQGVVAADIRVPGKGEYQIRPTAPGAHEVWEIDNSRFPPCATGGPHQIFSPPAEKALGQSSSDLVADGSKIDVMIVYTTDARIVTGGTINTEAEALLAVSNTNTAFVNSLVNTQLLLVFLDEIVYPESGNANTDLSRLTSIGDGFLDSVHAIRDAVGADNVGLFVSSLFSLCGQAWVMRNVSPAFQSSSFNVSRIGCAAGNLTYAHEVGHNLGCHHNRESTNSEGAFPYSFGFWDPGLSFRTVMGLSGGGPRIMQFSNPLVQVGGLPTGIPEGQVNSADNAKTINNTAFTMANFRLAVCSDPLPVDDCNNNGIADECEFSGTFSDASGELSPIGLGFPVSHTFFTPPAALGDVTLQFAAIADLASIFLALDVYLNDVFQGRIFVTNGSLCPSTPDEDQLVVAQADFNALVGSGDATIRIETGDSVEFDACDGTSWVSVVLDYFAASEVPDVNGNGVPDICDLARGDFNLDGVVNVTDLLRLLGAWGICPSCPEDTNLDGVVNVTDLLTLLANWG
ncbi:MAG: hypothetical protein IID30_02010 [Planctomycetes bacterium]|nr:hypothetical protein [Planctomycetota bacterium]